MRKKSLSVFLLTMICLATILSVRNWPVAAEYGFSSIFFLLASVLIFFIPCSLVSAELATGWPEMGGVYVWVKEAFGHRVGFLAVWLQWVENVIWYPTILSFVAGTLAYAFHPGLATHKLYTFVLILVVFWTLTLLNLKGIRFSGWISTYGFILGTIIPGVLIIGLGLAWWFQGKPIQFDVSVRSFFPDLSKLSELALLAGLLLSLAGMEMPAVHANDVDNPQKSYPRAIFFAATVIILASIFGTLAIASVIPQKEINLTSGSIEALAHFFNAYKMQALVPLIALLVAFGAIGGISTWIVGPSKGLLAAAGDGDLPPLMKKQNEKKMPIGVMIMQAIIVSLLASAYLFMPTINSSFWVLTALSSQIYLAMYILMFLTAIKLRYKHPKVKRAYRIGKKGNGMMWFVAGTGCIGCAFAILMGFLPPAQIPTGNVYTFETFMITGFILSCVIPFLIPHYTKRGRILRRK